MNKYVAIKEKEPSEIEKNYGVIGKYILLSEKYKTKDGEKFRYVYAEWGYDGTKGCNKEAVFKFSVPETDLEAKRYIESWWIFEDALYFVTRDLYHNQTYYLNKVKFYGKKSDEIAVLPEPVDCAMRIDKNHLFLKYRWGIFMQFFNEKTKEISSYSKKQFEKKYNIEILNFNVEEVYGVESFLCIMNISHESSLLTKRDMLFIDNGEVVRISDRLDLEALNEKVKSYAYDYFEKEDPHYLPIVEKMSYLNKNSRFEIRGYNPETEQVKLCLIVTDEVRNRDKRVDDIYYDIKRDVLIVDGREISGKTNKTKRIPIDPILGKYPNIRKLMLYYISDRIIDEKIAPEYYLQRRVTFQYAVFENQNSVRFVAEIEYESYMCDYDINECKLRLIDNRKYDEKVGITDSNCDYSISIQHAMHSCFYSYLDDSELKRKIVDQLRNIRGILDDCCRKKAFDNDEKDYESRIYDPETGSDFIQIVGFIADKRIHWRGNVSDDGSTINGLKINGVLLLMNLEPLGYNKTMVVKYYYGMNQFAVAENVKGCSTRVEWYEKIKDQLSKNVITRPEFIKQSEIVIPKGMSINGVYSNAYNSEMLRRQGFVMTGSLRETRSYSVLVEKDGYWYYPGRSNPEYEYEKTGKCTIKYRTNTGKLINISKLDGISCYAQSPRGIYFEKNSEIYFYDGNKTEKVMPAKNVFSLHYACVPGGEEYLFVEEVGSFYFITRREFGYSFVGGEKYDDYRITPRTRIYSLTHKKEIASFDNFGYFDIAGAINLSVGVAGIFFVKKCDEGIVCIISTKEILAQGMNPNDYEIGINAELIMDIETMKMLDVQRLFYADYRMIIFGDSKDQYFKYDVKTKTVRNCEL